MFNSKSLFIAVLAVCLTVSCVNPSKTFVERMNNAASDKEVTESEIGELDMLLDRALQKSPKGVQIGTKVIANHDDLVAYLREVKHCDPVFGVVEAKYLGFDKFIICMENSKSMLGYVGQGNSDLSEPIIALFKCGRDTTEFVPYVVSARGNTNPEAIFIPKDKNSFLMSLTNGRFACGESSPLDKIVASGFDMAKESLIDGVGVENVFCLITDGILSGTNSEIAANPDFNKSNLPLLEDRLREQIEKARALGMDCLVYRFETNFNGIYYDYRNTNHRGFNAIRPYFMILLGDRINLELVESLLAKETNFTSKAPKRFASYDVASLETIKSASLKRLPNQNGTVKGPIVEYTPGNIPVVFGIQFKLASLPGYYLNDEVLRQGLSLKYIDKTALTEVEIPTDDWLVEIESNPETKVYNFTVSLEPEILNRMNSEGKLILTLAGHQDGWYKALSTGDDTAIEPGDVTTFGLSRLMGGIMKAYGYDDTAALPNAIDYKFNVKRTK